MDPEHHERLADADAALKEAKETVQSGQRVVDRLEKLRESYRVAADILKKSR